MNRHKRTIIILLTLALLIPCTTDCALIQRSHFWQPDTANTEIVKTPYYHLIFQHGDVYFDVHQLGGYYVPYFFGPPFIPIFPLVLLHPHKKFIHAQIAFEIRSPENITTIDFSRIYFQYPGGNPLRPRTVEDISGQAAIKIPVGETVILKTKGVYIIWADNIPYNAEELLVDFGSLNIDGADIKLPVFRWRMVKKFEYEPFYLD